MMLFLSFVRLGLGLMHRAVRVVWRRIYSVELQPSLSGVYHVVEGSSRDNDRIAVMDDMLFFFIEDEFCLALLNPEKLVYIMVDLVPDFPSSLKAHYNQLGLLTGEQNLPEIIVLQCLLLDVSTIARQSGTSL